MLVYANAGPRRYDLRPSPPTTRRAWEFQAVVSGRCVIDLTPAASREVARSLCVFRPERAHGWGGLAGVGCEIVVAHYDRVPAELDRALPPGGYLVRPIDAGRARALRATIGGLIEGGSRRDPLAGLRAERVLIDLTLSILEGMPVHRVEGDEARRLAEAALAWYGEHLAERPTVASAAEAMAVSPGHLRRVFRQAGMGSPQQRFLAVRLDRSRELLERTDTPVKTIARLCGFSDPTDFARVMRREWGRSPSDLRQEMRGTVNASRCAAG